MTGANEDNDDLRVPAGRNPPGLPAWPMVRPSDGRVLVIGRVVDPDVVVARELRLLIWTCLACVPVAGAVGLVGSLAMRSANDSTIGAEKTGAAEFVVIVALLSLLTLVGLLIAAAVLVYFPFKLIHRTYFATRWATEVSLDFTTSAVIVKRDGRVRETCDLRAVPEVSFTVEPHPMRSLVHSDPTLKSKRSLFQETTSVDVVHGRRATRIFTSPNERLGRDFVACCDWALWQLKQVPKAESIDTLD